MRIAASESAQRVGNLVEVADPSIDNDVCIRTTHDHLPKTGMPTPNRAALIAKTHKVLKKHYQPVAPPADRAVLEHLLYGCCLENALYEKADEAFARLQQSYFDWNEIRVTTVSELSEVMGALPDPGAAAMRLKKCLQGVFETHYSFDLEALRKENIGKAIKQLEKYQGATPFGIAYVTQSALGGHSIPIDDGALQALVVVGVISDSEAEKRHVPGLERAIPKNKGVEFGSLLHQLGAEFFASPFSPKVRGVLTEIDPEAKSRMPKRMKSKGEEEPAEKESSGGSKSPASAGVSEAATGKKKPSKVEKDTDGEKESTAEATKKKSPIKRLARKKPR